MRQAQLHPNNGGLGEAPEMEAGSLQPVVETLLSSPPEISTLWW